MTEEIPNIDANLDDADWPKRTDDRLETLIANSKKKPKDEDEE